MRAEAGFAIIFIVNNIPKHPMATDDDIHSVEVDADEAPSYELATRDPEKLHSVIKGLKRDLDAMRGENVGLRGQIQAYENIITRLGTGRPDAALTTSPLGSTPQAQDPTSPLNLDFNAFLTRARTTFHTSKTGPDTLSGGLLFEGPLELEEAEFSLVSSWHSLEFHNKKKERRAAAAALGRPVNPTDDSEGAAPAPAPAPGRLRGNRQLREGVNHTHEDLQTKDGTPIDGRAVEAILKMAKEAFRFIGKLRQPAYTWTKLPIEDRNWWIETMERLYPVLRLCYSHWKAKAIAMQVYPSLKSEWITMGWLASEPESGRSSKRAKTTSLVPAHVSEHSDGHESTPICSSDGTNDTTPSNQDAPRRARQYDDPFARPANGTDIPPESSPDSATAHSRTTTGAATEITEASTASASNTANATEHAEGVSPTAPPLSTSGPTNTSELAVSTSGSARATMASTNPTRGRLMHEPPVIVSGRSLWGAKRWWRTHGGEPHATWGHFLNCWGALTKDEKETWNKSCSLFKKGKWTDPEPTPPPSDSPNI
ncbi:hypothetical protein CONPUDRAFT_155407 [Coniophora puteana RWD-64-598 SS2]|uniref:Uncharacterized protein n=1 Tax=Coniophora puteana (strain RWD-64-598) TaxID=741705 RepID=A0A5M3MLB8_CONPW|nr:uncharacterized protein CONPUDRAFT_155407 [Coniophora puteana RWD-64-598 SS2]EIW80032.1 hypothetical protein CONPUDRAFT_155407 [Coniophora puteana RWD-64-598 SS2]